MRAYRIAKTKSAIKLTLGDSCENNSIIDELCIMTSFVTLCKRAGVRHILKSVQLSRSSRIDPLIIILDNATEKEFIKISMVALQAFPNCDFVVRKEK